MNANLVSANEGSQKLKTGLVRTRVLERLLEAHAYSITAIVAPAGFGKTTAIRHMLAVVSAPIFIKVPAPCTLQQFMYEFARNCSNRFPSMKTPPDTLPSALDDTNQAIDVFLAWTLVHLKDAECTIAIDDVQNAEASEGIISFLVRLVDATKSHLKWILASRTRGSLPITRWQAYGDSDAPISADDLRITIGEAVELARSFNSPATQADLQRWLEQTNGFAVPLTFAIRTSANKEKAESIMDRTRSITFDYLAEQIWNSLAPDDRLFLEIASFLPPVHVHYLEQVAIPTSFSRAKKLAEDIAFITLNSDSIFAMHDLFRNFVQQQIQNTGFMALLHRRRSSADVLIGAKQFDLALRILVGSNDFEYVWSMIEAHDFKILDNSLVRSIAEAAAAAPPDSFGPKMLLLQTEFWSWFGDPHRARALAELFLQRDEATSEQRLRATRVMFRSLSFTIDNERATWIDRVQQISNRLDAADKTIAEAWLAAFLAQRAETHEASRELLSTLNTGIAALLPPARIDALIMISIAHFYLENLPNALIAAREAVAAADSLGDIRELSRAMNNLGIALWNAHDPELETLFEPLRDAVERSGCWAFSQVSHWLPSGYFVLRGDAQKTSASLGLLYDAPSINESNRARLRATQRHTTNLSNILAERYREVVIDDQHGAHKNSTDMGYELAIDAAIAYALESSFSASESALNRAKEFRKKLSVFESVSVLESVFIEIICLGANGQWIHARRLHKQIARTNASLLNLERALDRFCDGPPFTGLDELLEACYGKPYVGLIAAIIKRVSDRFRPGKLENTLSATEMEVLRLLSIGKSNKAIAEGRSRSPETIKRQLATIFRKLGVDNRTSAVAVAREQNLL